MPPDSPKFPCYAPRNCPSLKPGETGAGHAITSGTPTTGLDSGPAHYRSLEAQKDVFEHLLQRCAREGNKVLTVHSVRSVTPVLDMIESTLHALTFAWCCTGSPERIEEASRAADLGCYFSVNQQMVVKPSSRALLAALPLERILTETDGPFTSVGRRPARPSDVSSTVDELGDLFGMERERMASAIRNNLQQLASS